MNRLDFLFDNFDSFSEELKVLKEKLKEESEGFFNAIVESSPNFIAIVQDAKFVYVNSAAVNLFRAKSSSNIVGRNIKNFITSDFQGLFSTNAVHKAVMPGKKVHVEFNDTKNASFDCNCDILPFEHKGKPAILIVGIDITDEIRNRTKLKLEERMLADILNAFTEVVAFYSPTHEFIWLNNAGKKQLNIQDDSYIGKMCYKLWFDENKPCDNCPVVARKVESQEKIIKIGDDRTWMVRNTPLFDDEGKLTGYIEFRTDITEKEKTKSDLEKSHARQIKAEFTNLFGNFEIDLNTKNIELSPGTENILGISLKDNQDYTMNYLLKILHPDDADITQKYLDNAISDKKKFDRIFKILDSQCVEKTIRGVGEVRKDSRTGKEKFFCVIQDITKISNLEKQVFDERAKYKMLAEIAPFGLLLTQNNKPVYINRTLLSWLELESISDFEKRGLENIFLAEDKIIADYISTQIRTNNIPTPITKKLRLKDINGEIRNLRLDLQNKLINNQDYVQIVFTDITDDVIKEKKQKQITADALYINQKNSILLEIEAALKKALLKNHTSKNQQSFEKIFSIIDNYKQLDKDWKIFVASFEEVHPGFFSRLNKAYPKLSPIDIKHCACIKMNMDTKEIARFFNIKVTSVQISRVRIKKKMDLESNSDLRTHILNF